MDNILLIMPGNKPDRATLDFACYIAGIKHSQLTVLLVGEMKESELPVQKKIFALPYVETIVAADIPQNVEMMHAVEENVKLCGQACVNRNVSYNIRRHLNISVSEIVKESRFADLIIMNPETSLSNRNEGSPSPFVKEILTAAECPVILSPLSFEGISEIAFTYDDSEASVFAIKQFIHLFPEFNNKSVSLIRVNQSSHQPIVANDKILFLLKSHYSNIKIVHLVGDPGNEIFNYLLGKEDMFIVMGAFGRNMISKFFKRSVAEPSLQAVNLPFFITHNL